MIDLNLVEIKPKFSATGYEEIYQNLQVLYTTPVGTVVFDREFGIDFSIIDMPIELAKGRLIIEYIDKTRIYEPRVEVKEVNFKGNINGILIPQVVIELAN